MLKFILLAACFFALQGAFWYETHEILPDMTIVPDVPGEETVKALSLGDEQFFFRLLGLQLQNSGDTFGRFTALKKYDYHKLYHWFRLLDKLDARSSYIPSMAAHYFSQTQKREDVKYVVDYLVEHSAERPEEKWFWLVQAIYLANHKLENRQLAIQIAKHLEGDYDIPIWARQMPVFMYEQSGEAEAALGVLLAILTNAKDLDRGELNFMQHLVEERLGKPEEAAQQIEQIMEEINKRRANLKE